MKKYITTAAAVFLLSGHATAEAGEDVVKASGVTGGLVVKIGCGDADELAGLRINDRFLIHALDTDPGKVTAVRTALKAAGRYGKISVDAFGGKTLPYVDNLVNLLIAGDGCKISEEEILRVLAPRGVAMVNGKKTVKPWPENIDEWPHYLHGPDNNAVANDAVVGPPLHLQWAGPPRWTHHHNTIASISSLVSAGGRIFFVLDTGVMKPGEPGGWVVTARDAFNGIELWRTPISSWPSARFRSGPPQLPRLVVASKDHVYVPLGLGDPVSQLDAASGKTLKTFDATNGAEEILLTGKMLLVLRGDPGARHAGVQAGRSVLVAIDPTAGRTLWTADFAGPAQPETLAAWENSVFIQIDNRVVCLDKASGEQRWAYDGGKKAAAEKKVVADPKKGKRASDKKKKKPAGGGWKGGYGRHVLVVSDGVVLCNLAEGLVAVSVKEGKKLWTAPGGLGFRAPLDVFVINGSVWTGHHPGDPAPPPFNDFNEVRDLYTGEIKSTNDVSVNLQSLGHHHRCYRNKATVNYIMSGKRGIELFDLNGDKHSRNNWIRGTCQYGIMPANGLLYAPSHSCGCFPEVMVRGFYAMTSQRSPVRSQGSGRLQKGPAYDQGSEVGKQGTEGTTNWWPTFRGNVQRGSVVDTELTEKPTEVWKAKIGGRLSQPVVAARTLLVSSLDQHTVYAFDAKTGETRWSRTVGGPVDSPPTIHEGRLCLFGSADGYVYCLRLSDGELVWRFLAAPADRRTVVWGQIESVWPVHGSVLMLKGVAYFSAGRSTLFDHGIELYGLNPNTGQIVHHHRYETPQPKFGTGRDAPDAKSLKKQYSRHGWTDYKTVYQSDKSRSFSSSAGSLSDILLSDGTDIFLRHKRFGSDLKMKDQPARHLYAISGLLNDMLGEARTGWGIGDGTAGFGATGGGRGIYQKTGFVCTVLAYDSEKVWRGVNLKTAKQLVKVAGSGLQLAPVDSTGKGVAIALPAPVVWDGVAAADGRLYVSLTDGRVVCFQ